MGTGYHISHVFMRRAMLFYNPQAGQRRRDFRAKVERAAQVLRAAGIEVSLAQTLSSKEAGQQARDAVAQGFDTIIACGGDGTVQALAQGLIGSQAVLGVIPLGTANVLAHDLGLPFEARAAAGAALGAVPMRVAVGRIDFQDAGKAGQPRYFLSVAGIGLDGYLFHQLAARQKAAYGIAAYFLKAFRAWLNHGMAWFSASVGDIGAPHAPIQVTQLLAVRLHNFGSLLRDLAPGAALASNDFRLVLFRTASRWAYLRYVLRGIAGWDAKVPGIELVSAGRVQVFAHSQEPVYVQADGEYVGQLSSQLPVGISIVPNALTLLVPPDFASRAASRSLV